MRVEWAWIAERFLDQYLPRRIGNVIFAADHVGDIHFSIVNDDREMIEGVIDSARDRKIAQLLCIECDISSYDIVERDSLARVTKPNYLNDHVRVFLTEFFGNVCFILAQQLFDHRCVDSCSF